MENIPRINESSSVEELSKKGITQRIYIPPYTAARLSWANGEHEEELKNFVDLEGPLVVLCSAD